MSSPLSSALYTDPYCSILGILVVLGMVLVAVICLAVFVHYVMGAALSWPEEVAGINLAWLKTAIPLSGLLIVIYVSLNLIGDFSKPSRDNHKDSP